MIVTKINLAPNFTNSRNVLGHYSMRYIIECPSISRDIFTLQAIASRHCTYKLSLLIS